MPNFNNCRVGILLKDNSVASFSNPIQIKNITDTGVIINNNSMLTHLGISGSTGSSFDIFDSKRGIQIQNNSRTNIQNARILNTQYGFVSLNASSFDFNQSNIDGNTYTSFTGQAYGMFISDGSVGNIFLSSITGYAGGTGSLTSGNIGISKNSIMFVGTTADSLRVNISAMGSALQGQVFVDPSLGNKTVNNDAISSVLPGVEM